MLGDAEVQELDAAVSGDEDVAGLQIAVGNVTLMRVDRIRPAKDVLGDLVELSEVGHPWTHDQASRQAAVGPRRRAVRAQRVDA
ncbi:MAG TPA: hypothetical protein VK539_30020, partial [Myxococcaceae bacterium]|nr:hypothetical protein [Myxococcaceae bacterium]